MEVSSSTKLNVPKKSQGDRRDDAQQDNTEVIGHLWKEPFQWSKEMEADCSGVNKK